MHGEGSSPSTSSTSMLPTQTRCFDSSRSPREASALTRLPPSKSLLVHLHAVVMVSASRVCATAVTCFTARTAAACPHGVFPLESAAMASLNQVKSVTMATKWTLIAAHRDAKFRFPLLARNAGLRTPVRFEMVYAPPRASAWLPQAQLEYART
jgi:hypothetical protein